MVGEQAPLLLLFVWCGESITQMTSAAKLWVGWSGIFCTKLQITRTLIVSSLDAILISVLFSMCSAGLSHTVNSPSSVRLGLWSSLLLTGRPTHTWLHCAKASGTAPRLPLFWGQGHTSSSANEAFDISVPCSVAIVCLETGGPAGASFSPLIATLVLCAAQMMKSSLLLSLG